MVNKSGIVVVAAAGATAAQSSISCGLITITGADTTITLKSSHLQDVGDENN